MRLADVFSFEDQKEIGTMLRDAILAEETDFPVLSPSLNVCAYSYLNKIEAMLKERDMLVNARNFDWEIYLINDKTKASAYTLPGGYIFITTGMLEYVESESQLLSIITHEMAYADRGYAMDRLVAEYGANVFEAFLNGQSIVPVSTVAASVPNLVFDARVVKNADLFSASMICPFTYVAGGIVEILEKNTTDAGLDWLETKPSYADRKAFLEAYTTEVCCHGEETFTERYEDFRTSCFDTGG